MSETTPMDLVDFWFRDATSSPEALERRGTVWFERRSRVRPRVRDPLTPPCSRRRRGGPSTAGPARRTGGSGW